MAYDNNKMIEVVFLMHWKGWSSMDARTNMIIAKGKPVSSDAISCNYNEVSGKWDITFKNGKTYRYNYQNVTFLKNPTSLNPKSHQIHQNESCLII